jgi:predicted PurR-regulated permease PerM
MSDDAPTAVHEPLGPSELRDPFVRQELKRAGVWFGLALAIAAVIFLAQPLLLIFGGIVFASMLDGGTRLLGRVLPIGRGWRLLIVTLAALAFMVGTVWLAGVQLSAQAAILRDTVAVQLTRLSAYASAYGLGVESFDPQQIMQQALGSVGRLTSAVSSS